MKEDFRRIMDDYRTIRYGWFNCSKSDFNLKFCQQISPNLEYPQTILKHGISYSIKNLMNVSRIDANQMEIFLNQNVDIMFSPKRNLTEFIKEMKEKQIPVYFEIEAPDYYDVQYALRQFLGEMHAHFSYGKKLSGWCYREGIKIQMPDNIVLDGYEAKRFLEQQEELNELDNTNINQKPITLTQFVALMNHRIVHRVKTDQIPLYFDLFCDYDNLQLQSKINTQCQQQITIIAINEHKKEGKDQLKIFKSFLIEQLKEYNGTQNDIILFANKGSGSWKKWLKQQNIEYTDDLIDFIQLQRNYEQKQKQIVVTKKLHSNEIEQLLHEKLYKYKYDVNKEEL